MKRKMISSVTYRKNHGFTMIELMIAVLIIGILSTIGIPAYNSFIVGQRIKSASFDVISALTLARSEAIKRNAPVVITPLSNNWINGWNVSVVSGPSLNQQSPIGKGLVVTCFSGGTAVSNCPAMTYTNSGRLSGSIPTIQLTSTSNNESRCISVDLSGRPKSLKGVC